MVTQMAEAKSMKIVAVTYKSENIKSQEEIYELHYKLS